MELTTETIKKCFDVTHETLNNLRVFHDEEAKKRREKAAGDLLKYGHERSADAYGVAIDSLRILANSLGIEL